MIRLFHDTYGVIHMGDVMKIRVRYFNKKKFISGCILLILGICMPFFLTINMWEIPEKHMTQLSHEISWNCGQRE